MGFQVVVIFVDSFMDGFTYVRDVKSVCYIPACICYDSKNFGFVSLHDDYVGLATPQFYSVAPYRFDYRFVN
jgi:hypothetical protein